MLLAGWGWGSSLAGLRHGLIDEVTDDLRHGAEVGGLGLQPGFLSGREDHAHDLGGVVASHGDGQWNGLSLAVCALTVGTRKPPSLGACALRSADAARHVTVPARVGVDRVEQDQQGQDADDGADEVCGFNPPQ